MDGSYPVAARDEEGTTTVLTQPKPTGVLRPTLDNQRAFRDALGRFATGVTLVTAQGSEGPVGMTVNSFASVSLDPALVLWSLAKSSGRYAPFAEAQSYAIHVLADDQKDIGLAFARNGDCFDRCIWSRNESGTPLIDHCLARFECIRASHHDAGDHTIVVGEVQRFTVREGAPLVFAGGTFGDFRPRG